MNMGTIKLQKTVYTSFGETKHFFDFWLGFDGSHHTLEVLTEENSIADIHLDGDVYCNSQGFDLDCIDEFRGPVTRFLFEGLVFHKGVSVYMNNTKPLCKELKDIVNEMCKLLKTKGITHFGGIENVMDREPLPIG